MQITTTINESENFSTQELIIKYTTCIKNWPLNLETFWKLNAATIMSDDKKSDDD